MQPHALTDFKAHLCLSPPLWELCYKGLLDVPLHALSVFIPVGIIAVSFGSGHRTLKDGWGRNPTVLTLIS